MSFFDFETQCFFKSLSDIMYGDPKEPETYLVMVDELHSRAREIQENLRKENQQKSDTIEFFSRLYQDTDAFTDSTRGIHFDLKKIDQTWQQLNNLETINYVYPETAKALDQGKDQITQMTQEMQEIAKKTSQAFNKDGE